MFPQQAVVLFADMLPTAFIGDEAVALGAADDFLLSAAMERQQQAAVQITGAKGAAAFVPRHRTEMNFTYGPPNVKCDFNTIGQLAH